MFEPTEIAILHKALSELSIKGADAPVIAKLLNKLIDHHRDQESIPKQKKSRK